MKKPALSRRQLLGGAGACLPLPLLTSLMHARSAEAAGKPPLRLVVIQNRDGTIPSEFWPRVTPSTQVDAQAWQTPLKEIAGPLSGVLGTAFDGVRDKINVINGLDLLCNAFHQVPTFLCCAQTDKDRMGETGAPVVGSAVDCIVEHSPGFYTARPALDALRIADSVRRGSFWRAQGGTGPVTLKPYVNGAQAVWNTVMRSVRPGTPAAPKTSGPSEEVLLTDHLLGEYKRLRDDPRLGSGDRARLEQHYALLHDWQKTVLQADAGGPAPSPLSCNAGSMPSGTRALDRYNSYIDSIVAAFACGVTRIAALSMDHFDDEGTTNFGQHHSNSHYEYANGKSPEENVRIWDGWIARRVGTLVSKLDQVREADGSTLLDNCVVVWGNEDGYGLRHSSEGIPVLMAGALGGKLRTGHYLDYRRRPAPPAGANQLVPGAPLAGFWVAIMNAMGVQPAEWRRQGDQDGFGQSIASFAGRYADVQRRRTTPLPYLYKG